MTSNAKTINSPEFPSVKFPAALANGAVATILFTDPAADEHHRVEDYAVAIGTLIKSIADQLGPAAKVLTFCVLVPPHGETTRPKAAVLDVIAAFATTDWGALFKAIEIHDTVIPKAPKKIWNPAMKISGYQHTTQLKLGVWGLVQFHRVLYLDADSLQMRDGDISALFAMDLGKRPQFAVAGAYDAQKAWERQGEEVWRKKHPFAKHGMKLPPHYVRLNGPGVNTPNERDKRYKQLLTGCLVITPNARTHSHLAGAFEHYSGVPLYSDGDFLTDASTTVIGNAYAVDPLYCAYRGNEGGNPPYAIQYGGSNPWDKRAAKYPDVQPWICAAYEMLDTLPPELVRHLRGEFVQLT